MSISTLLAKKEKKRKNNAVIHIKTSKGKYLPHASRELLRVYQHRHIVVVNFKEKKNVYFHI